MNRSETCPLLLLISRGAPMISPELDVARFRRNVHAKRVGKTLDVSIDVFSACNRFERRAVA
jgi:hypothetical protein